MNSKENLLTLDDLVSDLEMKQERAQLVLGDLSQDYFELQEDCLIRIFHNTASIQCDIIFDYVCGIGEKLETVHQLLKQVIKETPSKNDHRQCIDQLLDQLCPDDLQMIHTTLISMVEVSP